VDGINQLIDSLNNDNDIVRLCFMLIKNLVYITMYTYMVMYVSIHNHVYFVDLLIREGGGKFLYISQELFHIACLEEIVDLGYASYDNRTPLRQRCTLLP
jgi:hypothetical protein